MVLVLSVLGLIGVCLSFLPALDGEQKEILHHADIVLCALFFVDFLVSFSRAPDKWRYMRTWGWLDLISSVPAVGPLRLARFARVVRLIRVLRGIRAAKTIAQFALERREQSAMLTAVLLAGLVVVGGSISILQVEQDPHRTIVTAEDAVWWAITTMTTVGYGDTYPITTAGRAIGVGLMLFGVAVFGAMSGLMASWLVQPRKAHAERTEMHEDIKQLRRDIQLLSEQVRQLSDTARPPPNDKSGPVG